MLLRYSANTLLSLLRKPFTFIALRKLSVLQAKW